MLYALLNRVSPDSTPDAYASGLEFHLPEFIIGFILGVILTLMIIAVIKSYKPDETNENQNKDNKE